MVSVFRRILLLSFVLSGLCFTGHAQVISIPFSTNFETGNAGFADSLVSGSQWQLGLPAYGQTSGAHSGQNAWDLDLLQPYQASTVSYLTTPFFNLGGNTNVILSFWQNRNTETGWDGTRLEYSTDGLNWLVMGGWLDPNATNWFTSGNINSSGLPAWEGTSGGWVESTYKLDALGVTGNIRFRFVFTSDVAVSMDGMSIDDFSIFITPPFDAGISALPNFPFLPAGSNTPLFNITVKNFGTQAFNAFTVSYTINNGPPVTVPSTFNLLPGSIVNITVPGFTIPSGSFSLCAYTSLATDTNHVNDTVCMPIVGFSDESLPYTTNFENGPAGWSQVTGATGTAWELGAPNFGLTNSPHSGNACWDINLDTGYTAGSTAMLYSPMFDFTGVYNASLNFFRNQNTALNDGVFIQYSTDAGVSWWSLGAYLDPAGMNWYNGLLGGSGWQPGWTGNSGGWIPCSYPLTILNNADSVMFCFIFSSYNTTGDGFSIDDLSISVPSSVDAGVSYIQHPTFYAAGSVAPLLDVVVVNYSAQPMDTVTVAYTINGGPPVTGTYAVAIAPGLGAMVTLSGYTVPSGNYTICAYTTMALDSNHINDTTCITATGLPVLNLPFADHFDGGNTGWGTQSLMNPVDQWELGTPSTGIPNAPFSAPSCWDINLNAPYVGPSLCYLYSPVFNFTNAVQPVLSFMQNRNIENGWDGVRMEYNLNGGSWLLLGYFGDPNGVNWYNDQIINASNFPGWTGNSSGWVQSVYNLAALNIPNGSQVGFRFVFNSDNVAVYDGMAIDNFYIQVLLAQDASLAALVNPSGVASSGLPTPVEVTLKNEGYTTLTALDLSYLVNGTLYGPFSWSGSLPMDSTELVTLPSFIPLVGNNNLQVYLSWPSDLNHFNDTLYAVVNGLLTVNVPYAIDFENGSLGWDVYATPFAVTSWEFGSPDYGVTTGSFSGDFCWDVNLDSLCGNLANTILVTPVFNFFNSGNTLLSCWINYATEPFADGFWVEYSTNGSTWQTLGIVNDPAGQNWYNTTLSSGQPAWSINSNGWKNATFNTAFLDGFTFVRFRFKFTSDFVFTSVGASMDDFSINNGVGVGEQGQTQINVYPNPVQDHLKISFVSGRYLSSVNQVTVLDISGREVGQAVPVNRTVTGLEMDVSGLTPGLYFIRIDAPGIGFNVKFIKTP